MASIKPDILKVSFIHAVNRKFWLVCSCRKILSLSTEGVYNKNSIWHESCYIDIGVVPLWMALLHG